MNNIARDRNLNLLTLNGCKYLIGMKVKIAKKHMIKKLRKGSVSNI
jgi:hypothetical protein